MKLYGPQKDRERSMGRTGFTSSLSMKNTSTKQDRLFEVDRDLETQVESHK